MQRHRVLNALFHDKIPAGVARGQREYHINATKEEYNTHLGQLDSMHGYLSMTGDTPCFPEHEDLPRNDQIPFDVFLHTYRKRGN